MSRSACTTEWARLHRFEEGYTCMCARWCSGPRARSFTRSVLSEAGKAERRPEARELCSRLSRNRPGSFRRMKIARAAESASSVRIGTHPRVCGPRARRPIAARERERRRRRIVRQAETPPTKESFRLPPCCCCWLLLLVKEIVATVPQGARDRAKSGK